MLSRNVIKNCKNCKNCKKKCQNVGQVMFPHYYDQMSQCHKSLGSLCSVMKTLIVSGAWRTNQGPKSPIEQFWTGWKLHLYRNEFYAWSHFPSFYQDSGPSGYFQSCPNAAIFWYSCSVLIRVVKAERLYRRKRLKG